MFLFLLLIASIFLILYTSRNFLYWSKRNVKHEIPLPVFGTHFKNLFGIKAYTQIAMHLYNKYPEEKVVGYFRGPTPELIIRDLDIVRNILNIDFMHFYPRAMGRNIEMEPLLRNLFHVDGDKWKLLRQQMTPAFTTAKLKTMFPLIINCAEKLHTVGEDIVKNGGEFDARELMARFTTDFIGACGFGIEMNTMNNDQSAFRELGKKVFTVPLRNAILLAVWDLFPEVRNYICVSNNDVERELYNIVVEIFKQRNYKPSGRNDFIDLLLELIDKGKIVGESIENIRNGTPHLAELELQTMDLVAQVFVFFAAGFETSSSATSMTLHQLALNPEIQLKVQSEIDEVLTKYDNKLCYDAISAMTLLDMALKEAMRLFSSLGFLQRQCARKYTIPQLGITIDPGVKVIIPIQAIHTDEKIFKDAKQFKPDRFSSEDVKNLHNYAYLPFGKGPRACIGARLGQMQSLAGLAAVLKHFSVEPSIKTRLDLQINPWSNVVQIVEGGIPLKLKLREK
ncbi:cytochrome P450 6a2-like [Pieris brassicae]|uniref:cytochrome P450 6a2-like n=1 Tax=Pieris brassicae TaxID=7116 RepID=UPI001E660DCC|nr:cytochrome P450 6a2-like [Pieris brassicae]